VNAHRGLAAILAVVAIVLGVAILIETALLGGGVGYVFGILFVALGAGRIYLLRKRRP
jgi:hypothetical protein